MTTVRRSVTHLDARDPEAERLHGGVGETEAAREFDPPHIAAPLREETQRLVQPLRRVRRQLVQERRRRRHLVRLDAALSLEAVTTLSEAAAIQERLYFDGRLFLTRVKKWLQRCGRVSKLTTPVQPV